MKPNPSSIEEEITNILYRTVPIEWSSETAEKNIVKAVKSLATLIFKSRKEAVESLRMEKIENKGVFSVDWTHREGYNSAVKALNNKIDEFLSKQEER